MSDDRIPAGYRRVEAYSNGQEIVVCGSPAEPEGEEESSHNCDEMGCGSLDHVLLRVWLSAHQRKQILERGQGQAP